MHNHKTKKQVQRQIKRQERQVTLRAQNPGRTVRRQADLARRAVHPVSTPHYIPTVDGWRYIGHVTTLERFR